MITGVKLEEMLTELEQKQKSVKRELRSCPQGSLMRTKENGRLLLLPRYLGRRKAQGDTV